MWEYVKGSKADFEGAPEWARYVDTLSVCKDDVDAPIWFSEHYESGGRFTAKNGTGAINSYDGDELSSIVLAERRKVEKKDPFAHLNDLPLVSEKYSTEALITERGSRYGEFKDGAAIMQQLKDVMHAAPKWDALKPSQKEALEMIQHKIGRILNGDPDYDDNWKDITGYATLIVKEIEG